MLTRRHVVTYLLLAGSLLLTATGLIHALRRQRPEPDTIAKTKASNPPPENGEGAGPPRGRLVVLAVFSQLRGDSLERWADHFGPDGFERLKHEGLWFSNAHLPYACTTTGPGHASIVTGALPSVHGIVADEWWDQRTGAWVSCCQPLTHPNERMPPVPAAAGTVGHGPDGGPVPNRLDTETVGDRLKAVTAGAGRVFSLALDERSAVLMGGRNPDGVYWFNVRDGRFHTSNSYRPSPHPWVTRFDAGRPADAWFDRKWDRFRLELDYTRALGRPDDAPGEGYGFNGQGRLFPHPYRGRLTAPARGYYEAVTCSPAGDELLVGLAHAAMAAEELGQRDTPDLLCLGFSSHGRVGRTWGPDSWEAFDLMLRTDRLVADLLTLLDQQIGRGRYTLVITADHGICPLPETEQFPLAARLSPARFFSALTQKLDDAFGPHPSGPTRWFVTNDPKEQDRLWPWVYLNHRALAARGLTVAEVAPVVRDWFTGRGWVAAAFGRDELERSRFPPGSLGAVAQAAYHPERCGDVLVIPQPGVLVTNEANGTRSGSPHPYDTHVPVLAYGAGVPAQGRYAQRVSALVVAPILARVLGIPPPGRAAEPAPF